MTRPGLPDGLEHVRTTAVFDNATAPAGLVRTHRVADGVWARLVVRSGSLTLVFHDVPEPLHLDAGDAAVIPPARDHHVELGPPVTFALEFFRRPGGRAPASGTESTGLRTDG